MEASEAHSFEGTHFSIPDTRIYFVCDRGAAGVVDMESFYFMGVNAWGSFDDRWVFARNRGLSDNLSGIVCKGVWRASWVAG